MADKNSEEDLKNDNPIYFKNGETFAESNYKILRKFEKKGMLQQILPFEKLPKPEDSESIEKVLKHAWSAAERHCQRDLIECNNPDPIKNLEAFRVGFKNRLHLLLLSAPS